jgi:putative membrane protein
VIVGRPPPLAHDGTHLEPQQLSSAWNADAVVLVALVALAWAYHRGRSTRPGRRPEPWRAGYFAGGLLALAVALLSPLDALSGALASAHMVQHLLLTLVAAPLLVLSAPGARLMRGSPAAVHRRIASWRRGLRVPAWTPLLRSPGVAWLLYVGTFWAWHAAVLYDAALEHAAVHALEHATFLVTGLLFWRTVIGVRAVRVPGGLGVLLLFGTAMSGALLSLLLTFADTAWYRGYATTTRSWGLDPLSDQHLAGAIMWVPAGMIHVVIALAVLVTWIRGSGESPAAGPAPAVPSAGRADHGH